MGDHLHGVPPKPEKSMVVQTAREKVTMEITSIAEKQRQRDLEAAEKQRQKDLQVRKEKEKSMERQTLENFKYNFYKLANSFFKVNLRNFDAPMIKELADLIYIRSKRALRLRMAIFSCSVAGIISIGPCMFFGGWMLGSPVMLFFSALVSLAGPAFFTFVERSELDSWIESFVMPDDTTAKRLREYVKNFRLFKRRDAQLDCLRLIYEDIESAAEEDLKSKSGPQNGHSKDWRFYR